MKFFLKILHLLFKHNLSMKYWGRPSKVFPFFLSLLFIFSVMILSFTFYLIYLIYSPWNLYNIITWTRSCSSVSPQLTMRTTPKGSLPKPPQQRVLRSSCGEVLRLRPIPQLNYKSSLKVSPRETTHSAVSTAVNHIYCRPFYLLFIWRFEKMWTACGSFNTLLSDMSFFLMVPWWWRDLPQSCNVLGFDISWKGPWRTR